MSKKNKKYTFCIGADLLECESLLEIKSGVTDDEWEQITSGTVKYYCYVKMLKAIGMPLLSEEWEKADEKLIRNLKRSIKFMEKIDPIRMLQFNLKEICDGYASRMLQGVHEVKELMKDITGRRPDGGIKIEVSDL